MRTMTSRRGHGRRVLSGAGHVLVEIADPVTRDVVLPLRYRLFPGVLQMGVARVLDEALAGMTRNRPSNTSAGRLASASDKVGRAAVRLRNAIADCHGSSDRS